MDLNLTILVTLLAAAAHSYTPLTYASAVPGVEHNLHEPTFVSHVNAWPYHQRVHNLVQRTNKGYTVYQQQSGGVVDMAKNPQGEQFHTDIYSSGNAAHQPQPAQAVAIMKPHHENVVKDEPYSDAILPFYEDQVTVLPQRDDEQSDNDDVEEEDWPLVGIYPPPPSPPVRPTYYPAHYPSQYPVTKPTSRPTITRPTTARPTTTELPSFYPKPPHYPWEELPHIPQYPPHPRPTTQLPPYMTSKPFYPKPGGADVTVLENYQVFSDKGIKKYKLRLSNGLTDYKKITKKHIGEKTIYVQNGYYSVPVDPTKNKFNLIYYIADERGYRIKGVQTCSYENPCKVLGD